MNLIELKEFLDEKVNQYNQPAFIEKDPIQIPRLFLRKENIEIAAFLTATIAWGNRISIIKNANRLMQLLDFMPFEFISNASENEFKMASNFVHRTFNCNDTHFFLISIKNIIQNHGGLEEVFSKGYQTDNTVKSALKYFYTVFLEDATSSHVRKHLPNVESGSAAKRMNMFLRWMVRNDNNGVDFGIWKQIPASALMLPLDVHTGNISRRLELLNRKQNDWKAVEEIMSILRTFDPADPVKYDFALFGLGAFENYGK